MIVNNNCLHKNLIVKITLAVIVFSLLANGCGRRAGIRPGELLRDLDKKSVRISGVKYVSAADFSRIYGVDWQWDPFSYHLILQKDNHLVVLSPQSRVIVEDGDTVYLDEPPIYYKSVVYLPFEVVERRLDRIFTIQPYGLPDEGRPELIRRIVIDAGHGGKDPGAIGPGGTREKDIVLDIAKRLKNKLEQTGLEVIMTRETDQFISLWRRADIANRNGADFFISIHANAARSSWASGFEVYYLSDACDDSARAVASLENAALESEADFNVNPSRSIKATVWDIINSENRLESIELADSICKAMQSSTNGKNRGVKSAQFYVLKGVRAPSVLVEVGFISNRQEEKSLNSPYYRQKVADALTEGILSYKKVYERTEGFSR